MSTRQDQVPPLSDADLYDMLRERGMTHEQAVNQVEGRRAGVESKQIKRQSRAIDHGAVSNFLRMAAQGATANFGDEIAGAGAAIVPGGKGYREARDASRERVAALREDAPAASMMAELAGGVALPAGGGIKLAKSGAGLLSKAVTGAASGGLLGGAYGAGDAEGGMSERMAAAKNPALIGAGLGVIPALAPVVARMGGSPAERVAESLEKKTGLSRNIGKARQTARKAIEDVRDQFYKPLEEAHKVIDDADVISSLKDPAVWKYLPDAVRKGARPVSYRDIQGKGALLNKLRTAARNQPDLAVRIDDIEGALSKAIPGHAEANAAYAGAAQVDRALKEGWRKAFSMSADMGDYMATLSPDAQNAFRQGQLSRTIAQITKRDDKIVGQLGQMMDAGPETQAVIRNMFETGEAGDEAFKEFTTILRKEKTAAKISDAMRGRWWVPVGGGLAYGVYKHGN